MKRALIYLIIFAALCSISGYLFDQELEQKMKDPSPYYLSFASIGAISLESRLDCWAKLNHKLSQDELKQRSQEIIDTLGILRAGAPIRAEIESDSLVKYTFQDGQVNYSISGQNDSQKNESYFLLKVITYEGSTDLSGVEKKLQGDKLDWQYYYLYTGKINHYMDKESRADIIKVILENLGAEGGELYEDDNASSIASFTPLFNNNIQVQEQKYNVQVAARSVREQQQAIVYIGQPLIMSDY